jgi:hypothetical protein
VAGPNIVQNKEFSQATSLVDLYPTLLELAKAEIPNGHGIDGHSLMPLLSGAAGSHDVARPQWALSQGHMADNAISWFVLREGDMKLIVYGTGEENRPQLFNITEDPMERNDLAVSNSNSNSNSNSPNSNSSASDAIINAMTATLKAAIDYPAVALDVADYNQKMFKWYIAGGYKSTAGGNQHTGYKTWKEAVARPGGLPGGPSGENWWQGGQWGAADAAIAAMEAWIQAPPKVAACRPFDWKPPN